MEGGAEELQPGGGGGGMDDMTAVAHSNSNERLVLSGAADECRSKQYCERRLMESKYLLSRLALILF